MSRSKHIRFDWAIKKMLKSKANFGILEGFLSELLKEDVKIQEVLENKEITAPRRTPGKRKASKA